MADALRLAEKGRYSVHPNPTVGCVLVRQDEVVGRGYHVRVGTHHAEAAALEMAGESARGATAYVTLEPCSFKGRTPSCADSMIKAGVSRVFVATIDPDPRNAGKGLQMLRDAGIEVIHPVLEASAKQLLKGHILRLTEQRPYVRLKLAMSLDGGTALANGDSKWITSAESRADVQKLRAMSGAIVTGVQTVIDDDPQLTVRSEQLNVLHAGEAISVNRPVYVLDPTLRVPRDAKLLAAANTVLVSTGATDNALENEVLPLPDRDGRVDLKALLNELANREHSNVLFECGRTLAGSVIEQSLADEVIIYVAAKLMGQDARSLLKLHEIARMADLVVLTTSDIRQVGADFRITAHPV